MSQGPEHGSQMPTSAGGDGRGCYRGHIAGAKDKVSAVGNPCAAPHGKPECSSGVTAFGTETLPRATLGNTAREVKGTLGEID
ncbi:unnamed protein product [Staurois parvus]|uniref:Uncharacterized protein n=1 Tax=Staurois parvus TaxID=386267 RepID=A0ABN9HUK2_9NEOB|nr:unnamed protein product [Staurois parvus]